MYCNEYNIDYLKHKNINSEEFLKKIKKYQCDLFVSMSFNQIFKKDIINMTKLKIINCHAGKLPFYRGRNILNWVLINDELDFGITVHFVDEGIDTGDIIMQRVYEIKDNDNYATMLEKSYVQCANILYDSIKLIQDGTIKAIKQSTINSIGFYCTQRKVGDENINWNQTSREVFNFIRAICFPGIMARAFINKKEMKINSAIEIKNAPTYKGIAGAILDKKDNYFIVKTIDSFIKVVDFEFDGKIKIGDRFE